MPNSCMMKNCTSSGRHDKPRSFHGFPQDPDQCKAWVEACGRPELLQKHSMEYLNKNAHVCGLHFKQSDRNKRKLKPKTVPVPYDQVPNENKSTQTDTATNSNDSDSDVENGSGTSTAQNSTTTDKGQRPISKGTRKTQQLKKLQNKLRRLQEGESILKPELLKLIEFQTELYKLTKDKQYAEKLRLYALNLYFGCPTTYKSIRSSLTLPTENVLRRTNLEIDTVMSNNVLMNLKIKISSLKAVDRYCVVSLKKMSLKRFLFYHINKDKIIGLRNINGDETMDPATEVYVLMARGLQAKWEQPLAYCFLGRNENKINISPWLDSVLVSIVSIGYDVVALVVDHEDLYDYCRNRIQSFTEPYFLLNYLTKVYCIFDLPQLIISLRNTLMTHNLQFLDDDGSLVVADWGIIQFLHSENNGFSTFSLRAKLTESHIHPNESEKKELKYAAEVFSKTVSEALEMESQMRDEYDNRIRGTQKLTALVNDIFDILNSSALNHHNKCKNAFTGEPYQMKAIRQFMEFLTCVTVNDCDVEDTSFDCIYGLRITIMSFSIILRDLLPKGINSLVTHRFNLDAADKLFEFVKQKSKSVKPTGVQFFKYFRQKFMRDIMKYPRTTNQDDNLRNFLNKVDFKQMSRHKMKCDSFKKTIEVETVDYRFELPKSHSFHYVCWYLLKKCYSVHDSLTCEQLSRFLHAKVHEVNWNCYNWDSYFRPPDIFIDFIKVLDERFNSSFGNKLNVGLGTGILLVLKELKFELICPCFPINYLRRLFVRLRIFNIVRYNNRQLWDEAFHFSGTDHYNIDIL